MRKGQRLLRGEPDFLHFQASLPSCICSGHRENFPTGLSVRTVFWLTATSPFLPEVMPFVSSWAVSQVGFLAPNVWVFCSHAGHPCVMLLGDLMACVSASSKWKACEIMSWVCLSTFWIEALQLHRLKPFYLHEHFSRLVKVRLCPRAQAVGCDPGQRPGSSRAVVRGLRAPEQCWNIAWAKSNPKVSFTQTGIENTIAFNYGMPRYLTISGCLLKSSNCDRQTSGLHVSWLACEMHFTLWEVKSSLGWFSLKDLGL